MMSDQHNEWRLKFSETPSMDLKFSDSPSMNLQFGSDIRPVISPLATNYEELSNKPSINGVELIGNKTNDDLNITAMPNTEIEELLKAFI